MVENDTRKPKVNNSIFSIKRTTFLSSFSNSKYIFILYKTHLANKNEKLNIDETNPKFKIGFPSLLKTLKRLNLFLTMLINSLMSDE